MGIRQFCPVVQRVEDVCSSRLSDVLILKEPPFTGQLFVYGDGVDDGWCMAPAESQKTSRIRMQMTVATVSSRHTAPYINLNIPLKNRIATAAHIGDIPCL